MKKEISAIEKKLDTLQEEINKMRGILHTMKGLKEDTGIPHFSTGKPKAPPKSSILYDLHTKKRLK